MSFRQPPVAIADLVPRWLRRGFLAVLTTHDLLIAFAGAWALQFHPTALTAATGGGGIVNELWGGLFLVGGALSLWGAVSGGRPRTDAGRHGWGRGLALETLGCVLVWGGYEVLAVATISAALFGPYSVASGLALGAAGLSSLRRIGRVWAGAFLAGRS